METLTSRRWNAWGAIALPYKDYSMDFKWSRSVMSDSLQPHGPGSSTHGIFQVRVLEWVAISFSTGSSQPRDRTWVSHVAGWCVTSWTTREATWREVRVSRLTAEEPESMTSAGWSRPLRRDRACCGLRNTARRTPGRRVSGGFLERILGTEEGLWGQAEEIWWKQGVEFIMGSPWIHQQQRTPGTNPSCRWCGGRVQGRPGTIFTMFAMKLL